MCRWRLATGVRHSRCMRAHSSCLGWPSLPCHCLPRQCLVESRPVRRIWPRALQASTSTSATTTAPRRCMPPPATASWARCRCCWPAAAAAAVGPVTRAPPTTTAAPRWRSHGSLGTAPLPRPSWRPWQRQSGPLPANLASAEAVRPAMARAQGAVRVQPGRQRQQARAVAWCPLHPARPILAPRRLRRQRRWVQKPGVRPLLRTRGLRTAVRWRARTVGAPGRRMGGSRPSRVPAALELDPRTPSLQRRSPGSKTCRRQRQWQRQWVEPGRRQPHHHPAPAPAGLQRLLLAAAARPERRPPRLPWRHRGQGLRTRKKAGLLGRMATAACIPAQAPGRTVASGTVHLHLPAAAPTPAKTSKAAEAAAAVLLRRPLMRATLAAHRLQLPPRAAAHLAQRGKAAATPPLPPLPSWAMGQAPALPHLHPRGRPQRPSPHASRQDRP